MTDDASDLEQLYEGVAQYYTGTLRRFGPTPLGVDWSCAPTQALRFRKLLVLCDFREPFSLNDIGCGYGALLEYLAEYHPDHVIDYLGIDLSRAMVRRARKLWPGRSHRFKQGAAASRTADYSIASGIFNVMLDHPVDMWERFVATTLTRLHESSRRGFAVNFVTAPRSGQDIRRGLYGTTPERWIDFCRSEFSRDVTLIDGYGMSEFTLLARSPD
jgi:SAM-dependent methyltransferase